jgi:hypothetical protein
MLGYPLVRPLRGGREQRLLQRVLGLVELAVPADEHAEDLRREFAQQALDAGIVVHISSPDASITGRTSMPVNLPSGI